MRASGYDRAASDWYVEPSWVVDGLLEVEEFKGTSWDPSCGLGTIPTAFAAHKLNCWGSDIVDRGFKKKRQPMPRVFNFFEHNYPVNNIISNPPYGVIEDYIVHALHQAGNKVALLARLALLEGQKRQRLLKGTPLARVWVSSRRVSMPPGGTDVEAKGGTVAYAWFVWEHGHKGPATIGWI